MTHYNPGAAAIFPVSSTLVTGEREAILIDAQFGKSQAAKVVDMIRASGKKLSTIYISHGDPDFYFGLDTVLAAFPDAKVVASEPTVRHIKETVDGKLAYWGPKLGADAPARTVVPEVLAGNSLTLEGRKLEINGLDGAQPDRSFVWIPSLRTVAGGVVVFGNLHVWMADTQTPKSHQDWLATLARSRRSSQDRDPRPLRARRAADRGIGALHGRLHPRLRRGRRPGQDSAALIAAMKAKYPQAGEPASLELSAKVAKGESGDPRALRASLRGAATDRQSRLRAAPVWGGRAGWVDSV